MEETRPDGIVLSWTYDAQGHVTERSTPTGTRRYSYDALGRLTQVTGSQGAVTTYAYDAAGRLQIQSYPNGVSANYRYDVNGRLTQLLHSDAAGAVLTGTAYGLAADGTRTELYEYDGQSSVDANGLAQNPLRSTHYAYDGSGRLTEETVTGRDGQALRTVAYTYDKVGNRLNKTETTAQSSTVIGYTYDSNDRLTQESKSVDGGPAQVTAYSWDANGRLIKKAAPNLVTLYRWDSEDHLLDVKHGATEADAQIQAQYAYDADGQRIQKLEKTAQGDKMTRYLIDATFPYAQVVEETTTQGSQTETVRYLWGLGLIAQTRAGQGSYYHADGLGSVKALSDAQGQTTDAYDYDAFGAVVDHIGSSGQPYRFAGEYYDADAQMQYHRARWYDPNTGRFAAMDPFSGLLTRPATLHKYAYANSDPTNVTDPSGLFGLAEVSVASDIATMLSDIQTDFGLNFISAKLDGDDYSASSIGWGMLIAAVPMAGYGIVKFLGSRFKTTKHGAGRVIYSLKIMPSTREIEAAEHLARTEGMTLYLRSYGDKGADSIIFAFTNTSRWEIKSITGKNGISNNIKKSLEASNQGRQFIIDGRRAGLTEDMLDDELKRMIRNKRNSERPEIYEWEKLIVILGDDKVVRRP